MDTLHINRAAAVTSSLQFASIGEGVVGLEGGDHLSFRRSRLIVGLDMGGCGGGPPKEKDKGRDGSVAGRVGIMEFTDWLLLGGFALILAVLFLIHRSTMILTHQLLEEIDHRVAAAIKAVVDDLAIEGIEPPNPIQQFLMSIVAEKMNAAKIPRGSDGQFTPVIDLKEKL